MRHPVSRISSPRSRRTAALALVLTGLAGTAAACPDWRQTGQQISLSADQLWSPQSFSIRAGGAHNLANCPVPARGYADSRPHFDLNLTDNAARRELHVSVVAECDTVLLINDARAQWNFNDDSDGLNPRIVLPDAPAGVYDIWVGTYSPTPCLATVTFETMGGTGMPQNQTPAACPEPGRNGQMLGLGVEQLRQSQRFGLTSGTALDLGACGAVSGQGRIAQRPDFTLSLTGSAPGAMLELRAESGCDPVLLVNDPRGQWHFNDDADGLNSRLTLPAEPGLYDLWVGSYGGASCGASLVATVLGGQPAPQPQPQPQPAGDGLVWRFQSDPQGWTARDAALSMAPGSHMQITAWGDSRVGYLIAPPVALGDWRGVTGIEAVMRSPGGRYFGGFSEGAVGDLVIYNGTMTAAASFPHWLGPDWARLTVPLREAVTLGGTRLWQLGGGARSLDQVLANVTAFQVRGEFHLGDTTADVAEIAIRGRIVPAAAAVPAPAPQPMAGVPAAAGVWRINGNNYPGTLTLTWTGAGWTGVVNYDVYRRDEPLEGVRFDPATGAVEFVRPIGGGSTQHYRGRLSGGQMAGEFNQGGGAYQYRWSATLSAAQAPIAPAPGPRK